MQQWYPYQQRHIWECYMRWTLAYRSFSTQLMRWKEFHFSKNLGRKVYIIVVEIVKPFSVSVHVSNLLIHGSDWYLLEPICVISYCNEQDFFTTVWILWLRSSYVHQRPAEALHYYTSTNLPPPTVSADSGTSNCKHTCIPWKINMEPENDGLEDDFPFQLGGF